MDLLLSMLLIEDSWQSHRIHNALKGVEYLFVHFYIFQLCCVKVIRSKRA